MSRRLLSLARPARRLLVLARNAGADVWRYLEKSEPRFTVVFGPALLVSALLFVRSPWSNYIFDEQEALLANPYVNAVDLGFWDVFKRDFWGLPPTRSIGSYRPIPNMVWRLLWQRHEVLQHPWIHHWVNVIFHAFNAALVSSFAFRLTRRRSTSWLAGGVFVTCAVLTEAVTGVVGIADCFGALGLIAALAALNLPLYAMPLAVFGCLTFGFFSKESTLVALPIVAWVALVSAPLLHPNRPLRVLRLLFALAAAVGALILYAEVRRRFFPSPVPEELRTAMPESEPLYRRALHEFLRWFQQPKLPKDPINNPLVDADMPHRLAGALRVYTKSLGQLLFPWSLSGDYSYAQEPIPEKVFSPLSVLGGALLAVPPLAGVMCWVIALVRERRTGRPPRRNGGAAWAPLVLAAIALVWVPVAYYPHSNIPVLLPTVRAERFMYLPAMGAAFGLAALFAAILRAARERGRLAYRLAVALVLLFVGFQSVRARMHALHYSNDLTFWRAMARAAPNSAKAHLNYGVMLGARGQLENRLRENRIALDIAPDWPMAHVYYGDTLCRLNRVEEAWPHYRKGFVLAPNDKNLIALALQCLWDKGSIEKRKAEILRLARQHPGTWVAYLGRDIVYNGEEHGGVAKEHRPRGYDEGPKK